jgi:8-oxo-dGTP diphosphatase
VALLVLIRHAHAGQRERWQGDDRLRPLSKKGRRQSEQLSRALADVRLQRILTSPYVRCVQTVEPLAEAHGLGVEETDDLSEGVGLEVVLDLFQRLSETPAALCTHGDVMFGVCSHLVEQGLIRRDDVRYGKGSAWLLEQENGEVVAARYLPVPKS